MRIHLTNAGCTLYRDPGDKRLKTETAVTHAMKQLLLSNAGIYAHRMRGIVGLTACKQTLRLPTLGATLWHERYTIEAAHTQFNNTGKVFYQRVDDTDRTEYETEVIDYPLRYLGDHDVANQDV